jgi:hypothetical protein|tara:strand:+ start:579 stop:1505 length:927 start_codon:yes stop_codon:yes gene_type:complete
MDKKFQIFKYAEKYEQDITKLYFESYGRKKPQKYFRYRLKNNGFGTPIAYVMKFNSKIVGFYALTPISLIINNVNYLGGYSFLTMTDKKFSGQGIFSKLASKTFEKANEKKYNFIIGFANNNSFPLFINKFGFTELKPINYVKLNLTKVIGNKDFKFNRSIFKKNNFSKLNFTANNYFSVYLDKNFKSLDNRINQHPLNKYYIFQNDTLLFIFKKYQNELQILDFFGYDEVDLYSKLSLVATNLSKKLKCDYVTLWIPKQHPLNKHVKSTENLSSDSHFIVKSFNPKIKNQICKINNWYYSMSDSDVF